MRRALLIAALLMGGCDATPAVDADATTPAGVASAGSPGGGTARTAPVATQTRIGRRPATAAVPDQSGTIGSSVNDQPIIARDFGEGPVRVYLIGLIHGSETPGLKALPALERSLARDADAAGARVRVVANMNPDGHARKRRGNARGIDLNRNWPASNFSPSRTRGRVPASEPEVAAVLADLRAFRPDALIVFHSISGGGPFVNFDGPPPAPRLAAAFADAALAANGGDWRVVPDMGYPTPGSLGTWAGVDSGIPTLTIEFERRHPQDEADRAAVAGVRAVLRVLGGRDTVRPEDRTP